MAVSKPCELAIKTSFWHRRHTFLKRLPKCLFIIRKQTKANILIQFKRFKQCSGLLLYLRSRNLSCSELWMETSSVLETEALQMTRQQSDE